MGMRIIPGDIWNRFKNLIEDVWDNVRRKIKEERGSFTLKETKANHLGKMGFRWVYWNVLLPGHSMPVPTHMSMVGKTPVNTNTT